MNSYTQKFKGTAVAPDKDQKLNEVTPSHNSEKSERATAEPLRQPFFLSSRTRSIPVRGEVS